MGFAFNTIKWFVFTLNIICLFLGVGAICVNAMGVESAQPGTDAHTFFVLAILLCSLLCLTTVIGCYGVFSEIFGINVIRAASSLVLLQCIFLLPPVSYVIDPFFGKSYDGPSNKYSIFVLSLMIIQYLQIRSFQPHELYFNNLQHLESAWRLVETQPKHMDTLQSKFYCCGLFNSHDYSYKHLSIPDSCYSYAINNAIGDMASSIQQTNNVGCLETMWRYYKFAVNRHIVVNWALLVTESITFIYSIILSILILKRRLQPRFENLNRAVVREFAQQNHIGSRQFLLSN